NQFKTDAADQFTLTLHNPNPTTGSGSISGKVRNKSGCGALSGATVNVGGTSTTTAADGTYHITIAPGTYSFTAKDSGFNSSSANETVNDSLDTQLNFYLTPEAGGACTLSSVNPSVTICSPAANATVASPVHVVAGATDSNTVSFMQVYV